MNIPLISSIAPKAKLAITLGLLSFVADQACANLVMDLRAVSKTGTAVIGNNGKSVFGVSVGDTITFELYAQVTGANPLFSSSTGSILSNSALGNQIAGNLGGAVNIAPFTNAATVGGNVDLNSDGSLDYGSNAAATTTGMLFTRSGGLASGGVGVPIAGGAEFKLFSVVMTVTRAGIGGATSGINWRSAVYTTGASAAVNWGEGGLSYVSRQVGLQPTKLNAGTGADQPAILNSIGADVVMGVVPEPSAFGMVLVGALSMVGFRRFSLRRQS